MIPRVIGNWDAAEYPFLREFAKETGIPEENLVAAFEIERAFHRDILETHDPVERRKMYADVYTRVHPLLRSSHPQPPVSESHRGMARLFRRELMGKSVLDVGCGTGELLFAIEASFPHGELCGMDVSTAHLPDSGSVRFIEADVTDFRLDRTFDVVLSNQVLEHIAPEDVPQHLNAISRVLSDAGTAIMCLPNRFWGPSDVTRIVDNRYCGLTPAQGTHLNEGSYKELVPVLKRHGFIRIRTVFPLADRLPIKSVRISPAMNMALENLVWLRSFCNRIKRHGRPVFRNPVILIAQKGIRTA